MSMPTRAMIVVGGGSSTRFGHDKLMAEVAGVPLIVHTIDSVTTSVDRCVVVCRAESIERISELRPAVTVTAGGATRTLSEMAGLAALGGGTDLIGIHDAARPAVDPALIDQLFKVAARSGGAVPLVAPERLILDKRTHQPLSDLRQAQTPQVFRGPALMTAYVKAAQTGFEGQDTVEVMQRFGDVAIAGVPGDPANLKVTYPGDLDAATSYITGRFHT